MLLPFFQWMQELPFSQYFLTATWSSPIVQCVHLVAIAVFVGAMLIVDIRLLGRGLVEVPVATLAKGAEKWLIWSFVMLIITGVPQLMSTALKQYYSPFFFWKMQVMALGLIFTFTIRRRVANAADNHFGPWVPKAVALVSMVIWSSVTIWARLIGLFS